MLATCNSLTKIHSFNCHVFIQMLFIKSQKKVFYKKWSVQIFTKCLQNSVKRKREKDVSVKLQAFCLKNKPLHGNISTILTKLKEQFFHREHFREIRSNWSKLPHSATICSKSKMEVIVKCTQS